MERKRTFTWEDPKIGAEKAKTLTGIDYLKAMKEGLIPPPPVIEMMDFSLEEIRTGNVTFHLYQKNFIITQSELFMEA